jgi:hypothetical protein
VLRFEMVHPTVKGAENFFYQIWPVDETHTWIAEFGTPNLKQCWRMVKMNPGCVGIREITPRRGIENGAVPANQKRPEENAKEKANNVR